MWLGIIREAGLLFTGIVIGDNFKYFVGLTGVGPRRPKGLEMTVFRVFALKEIIMGIELPTEGEIFMDLCIINRSPEAPKPRSGIENRGTRQRWILQPLPRFYLAGGGYYPLSFAPF